MVHGVVLSRVPYRDVDDIVHDVFVTVFERLGSLREPAAHGRRLNSPPPTNCMGDSSAAYAIPLEAPFTPGPSKAPVSAVLRA